MALREPYGIIREVGRTLTPGPSPSAAAPRRGSEPCAATAMMHVAQEWATSGSPPGAGPAPTPQVLDDVQGGTPGEALHGPQLQLSQVTRQGLQLVGAPLPPVQKHTGADGGLPRGGRDHWGWPRAGRPAQPSPGREAFWERLGALELTNGQGPGPTQRAFLPLLQTFYKFRLPGPLEAPAEEMGRRSGPVEARKRVRLFRGRFAGLSFQRRKMCCPTNNSSSPPLTSDLSPQPQGPLQNLLMSRSTFRGTLGGPLVAASSLAWVPSPDSSSEPRPRELLRVRGQECWPARPSPVGL